LTFFTFIFRMKITGQLAGWPLFWKTWKSQGIEKWSGKIGQIREKSGKMNYYNYSVAAIIVKTIIGDYNNSTIDHSQLIF